MSEEQAPYNTETQEAMDMLGKGYEHPAFEIHRAETVIMRRGKRLVEEVVPAFIKLSTGFKKELPEIDPSALAVWLFIALSINRNTEQAHPGIRTIADGCGLSPNTVTAAIKRLEESGLLTVDRDKRKYNIYEIPEYVSVNSKTVANNDTDKKSVAMDEESVATKPESVATALRLNHINHIKPDITHKPDFVNLTVVQAASLPELRLFREATGSIPGQGQWEVVWQTIRDMRAENKPITVDRLRPYYLAWTARGYNPRSLNWLTEWARSGTVPGNGHESPLHESKSQLQKKIEYYEVDLDKPILPQLEGKPLTK